MGLIATVNDLIEMAPKSDQLMLNQETTTSSHFDFPLNIQSHLIFEENVMDCLKLSRYYHRKSISYLITPSKIEALPIEKFALNDIFIGLIYSITLNTSLFKSHSSYHNLRP